MTYFSILVCIGVIDPLIAKRAATILLLSCLLLLGMAPRTREKNQKSTTYARQPLRRTLSKEDIKVLQNPLAIDTHKSTPSIICVFVFLGIERKNI